MGSLWGCSFIMPIVGVFSGTMPFTPATAITITKKRIASAAIAAKVVANTTQVARAAYQRRFSAPGGQVKSPLSGTYAPQLNMAPRWQLLACWRANDPPSPLPPPAQHFLRCGTTTPRGCGAGAV